MIADHFFRCNSLANWQNKKVFFFCPFFTCFAFSLLLQMSFTIKEDNISIFNADITSSFNVSYDSYFRLSFSCRKGTTKYDVSTSCPNLIVFILKKKPARLSFSGYLSLKTFNNQSGHPTISRRVTIKQVLVGGDGEHITGLNVVEASDEFWLLQYIHENYDRWDIQTKHRPLAILSKLQDMVSARARKFPIK